MAFFDNRTCVYICCNYHQTDRQPDLHLFFHFSALCCSVVAFICLHCISNLVTVIARFASERVSKWLDWLPDWANDGSHYKRFWSAIAINVPMYYIEYDYISVVVEVANAIALLLLLSFSRVRQGLPAGCCCCCLTHTHANSPINYQQTSQPTTTVSSLSTSYKQMINFLPCVCVWLRLFVVFLHFPPLSLLRRPRVIRRHLLMHFNTSWKLSCFWFAVVVIAASATAVAAAAAKGV